jgi:2-polyprenyl-6-methoxyphenol hydroxylase-like FAD-dependent oxidoreductase
MVRVLISGGGIAGTTLAYWLAKYGLNPTILEIAAKPRTGGYVIDFWGAGFDVAERMHLIPRLREVGYAVREVRVVDRTGRRVSGFASAVFSRATHGRFTSIARSDLAACIFDALPTGVETIFGDSISRIEQRNARRTLRHPTKSRTNWEQTTEEHQ